jgi:hypothetical protein
MLKKVSQNAATCLLVGVKFNEARAAIGRANGIFRKPASYLIRLIVAGAVDVLPDLFLSCVIGCDGERHELLQGHAIFGIDSCSFGDTDASRSRCFTTAAVTKCRAAMSSSVNPASRKVWKARN